MNVSHQAGDPNLVCVCEGGGSDYSRIRRGSEIQVQELLFCMLSRNIRSVHVSECVYV